MVDNWNEFIRLAVLSKEPQPVTRREREDLKREIDQQTEKINDYTRSVNIIELEHLDTFKKIEDILKPQPAQQHQTDINLRSELRPIPLTANSSLIEVITFSRNFSRYVQSGNCQADQLPEGTIFDLAKTNVDNFWMTMLKGWGFENRTQLHEFIDLIEAISKNKFPICDRRSELFGLRQANEDPVVFLSKVDDMVKNADWDNITQTDATLLIFQQGVNCAQSKQICPKFIKPTRKGISNN